MAKRSELWYLQNKLSDVIVLGRTKLIRSPKWHTINQSKEVHYCSLSLKKAQPAISVDIGSSLFVKSTHAEGSHDAKSSECTAKDLFWDLTNVVTNENCSWFNGCSTFIYLFCLEINFNPFKIDKGTFLSCCPIRNSCPNHYIYTSPIVSCIFLDKIIFLLLHSEKIAFTPRLWIIV